MFEEEQLSFSDIVNAMYQYHCVPEHWQILKVFHTSQGNDPQENQFMMVQVATDINVPKLLLHDIKIMIDKPWRLVLNRKAFRFDQSIFEFRKFVQSGIYFRPRWAIYINASSLPQPIESSCLREWADLSSRQYHSGKLVLLSVLFVCEQIDLREEEYSLLSNDILVSNLTKRVLLENEFEINYDKNGNYARVCLSDTHFASKKDINGSLKIRMRYCLCITGLFIFVKHFVWAF